MTEVIPCENCPLIAICRTKIYQKMLDNCSRIVTLINYTSQIRTVMYKVEEILNPTTWEVKVDKDQMGRLHVTILQKTDGRYARVEAEYDLYEHAVYDITEAKSGK